MFTTYTTLFEAVQLDECGCRRSLHGSASLQISRYNPPQTVGGR